MTYSQYGLIEASDFNTFTGNTTATTANQLNTVWAVGTTNAGYGQTAVPQVAQFQLVNKDDWGNLITTTRNIALHQGTSITQINPPSTGDVIQTIAAIQTNLNSVYTNRNNAVAQSSTFNRVDTYNSTWQAAITCTQTVTFANSASMRYFFNAGGQIALNFIHSTGSGINPMLSALAQACGTLVLSNINSGTCTIAGQTYSGFTKVGGSGSVTTLATNTGFRALTSSNQEVYKQFGTGTPSAYTGTFISVNLRLNSTHPNASQLIITTLWDEVPNGGTFLPANAGTTVSVSVRPPSTTYLTNTWGTPTLNGSWSGS